MSAYSAERDLVLHTCGATQIVDGPDAARVARIATALAALQPQGKAEVVTIDSNAINAWATRLNSGRPLVCIAVGLVRWTDNDSQLAFVIAHELAHADDDSCRSRAARARLSTRRSILSLVAGSSSGNESGDQRRCESRADELGFRIMTNAGYDSLDAVKCLEKLQFLAGNGRPGLFGWIAEFTANHPRAIARIRHLQTLMRKPPEG